ncbi:MAG: hypothetical protein IT449_11260 [Phycisphaerales bacterium]|nr:hypothetical protein [Phycisphaerales bacterium]
MTNEELLSLTRDFLDWSGGFAPESLHQLTVYLDYALDPSLEREDARDYLIAWMNDPESILAFSHR